MLFAERFARGRRKGEQFAQIGALAGGRDLAGFEGFVPLGAAGGEEEEHERLTFHDVRRGAAAVPGAFDALHRTVRRDAHFHSVTRGFLRERLQQRPDRALEGLPVGRFTVVDRGHGIDHSVHGETSEPR